MKKDEVYKAIIAQNGISHQMTVAIEELSELTKELTKHIRKDANGSKMHLAEEIGDVRLCLEQLAMYFGIEKEIEFFKKFKIERLEKFYIKGELVKSFSELVLEGTVTFDTDGNTFDKLCKDMVERGGGGTVTPLDVKVTPETGVKEK